MRLRLLTLVPTVVLAALAAVLSGTTVAAHAETLSAVQTVSPRTTLPGLVAVKRVPRPQPKVAPTWDRLARCESGGRWRINTGNGYYGGLQISAGTWAAFGGRRVAALPHHATKAQQVRVAERIRNGQGWGAWPHCSRVAGLR